MDITPILPARLRVGYLSLKNNATLLRLPFSSTQKPPFKQCHSQEELKAIQARTLQRRQQSLGESPPWQTSKNEARETSETLKTTFSVRLAKSGELFDFPRDQTLLESGLNAGIDLDFSCAMGGCASCKIKVLAGDVEMDEPNCLTPEERKDGEILACVARPRSPLVLDL